MVQSENGYFEGVNTSAESSRRVYGAIKMKKGVKRQHYCFIWWSTIECAGVWVLGVVEYYVEVVVP